MLKDAPSAVAVAEALIRAKFGEQALKEQRPLTAKADGEFWQVEGSLNRGSKEPGAGPVKIRFRRSDMQVVSLHFSIVGMSLNPVEKPEL
ncbi:MAG: NTF2 fold immunity protein [Gemmatimonas sp.]